MKVLIIGSSGFIGGSVGRFAARSGHALLGVSRRAGRPSDWPGEYVSADVATADLSGVIQDFAPDLLLHAAGTASVSASLAAPVQDLRAAILPWANVLESVRCSQRVPLVLFLSSAAVYGNPPALPVHEDMPMRPISPYGFHKAMSELLANEYAQCFNLNIVICRLFSVFGSEQRRLLVHELYDRLVSSQPAAWVDGTGAEVRDYLHIEDVAAACLQLAQRCGESRPNRLVVNMASGRGTNVLALAEMIRDLVAPQKEILCRGVSRHGDPGRWQADITRLRELLPEWQPSPLCESLARCVAAWQSEAI